MAWFPQQFDDAAKFIIPDMLNLWGKIKKLLGSWIYFWTWNKIIMTINLILMYKQSTDQLCAREIPGKASIEKQEERPQWKAGGLRTWQAAL